MIRIGVICDECGALTCRPWGLVLDVHPPDKAADVRVETVMVCGGLCACRALNRMMFPLERELEKEFTKVA